MKILSFLYILLLAGLSTTAQSQSSPQLVAINLEQFNTPDQDMCPLVSADNGTFYFTREHQSSTLSENLILQATRTATGGWGRPEQMKSFKQASVIGAITMDSAGDTYISYLPFSNSGNDLDIGKINGEKIVKLEDISATSWDSQPSITGDGRELYFASNREGEKSTVRIFVSHREGADWSKPVALDANINSDKFTGFPSISADGKVLFFSTNRKGHGMEIWAVTRKDRASGWSSPFPLLSPVNVEGNNVFSHLAPNGHEFYFASDRVGTKGRFDLYEIVLPNGIQDLIGAH